MFFDNAYSFTGEKLIFLPLPLCLSVDVITPKIFKNYFIPGFLPDRWVDKMTGKMLALLKK